MNPYEVTHVLAAAAHHKLKPVTIQLYNVCEGEIQLNCDHVDPPVFVRARLRLGTLDVGEIIDLVFYVMYTH